MFRSRRSTLIKKLLALQECPGAKQAAAPDPSAQGAAKILLKDIGETEILKLLLAVLREGARSTTCIVSHSTNKHVSICKLWRWPLYRTMPVLKQVPICNNGRCDGFECLNPYHYYLPATYYSKPGVAVTTPSQIPPLGNRYCEQLSSDSGICVDSSDTLSPEIADGEDAGSWCNIAYWEHNQRIGALHTVTDPIVVIANKCTSGMDLTKVGPVDLSRDDVTSKVRRHVGSGVLFSLEEDGIWVYNRSEISIFVQSPTLGPDCQASKPRVHKILPGYTLNAYCFAAHPGVPRHARTIRISFEKGWGPGYRRQYVTESPCWVEVLLSFR